MDKKEMMAAAAADTKEATGQKIKPTSSTLPPFNELSNNAKIDDAAKQAAIESWQKYAPKGFENLIIAKVDGQ